MAERSARLAVREAESAERLRRQEREVSSAAHEARQALLAEEARLTVAREEVRGLGLRV
jgi:hypothetical protein